MSLSTEGVWSELQASAGSSAGVFVSRPGSLATCRDALTLDTALARGRDALNPADLLVAALSACMIKGIERAAAMLTFSLRGVEIRVHGVREDVPPRMERLDDEIVAETDEPDHRLELLHDERPEVWNSVQYRCAGNRPKGVLIRAT